MHIMYIQCTGTAQKIAATTTAVAAVTTTPYTHCRSALLCVKLSRARYNRRHSIAKKMNIQARASTTEPLARAIAGRESKERKSCGREYNHFTCIKVPHENSQQQANRFSCISAHASLCTLIFTVLFGRYPSNLVVVFRNTRAKKFHVLRRN